jgi:peptide/nickel transport system substrate-binding protein
MRRMTRRELLAGTAATFAACSRPLRSSSAVTILYPESETVSVLGPYEDTAAQFLVFLPLAAWNRRGQLEPRLAESWEYSDGGRTCTIRLRDGIRWHDGMPVTAHDMKFTLDLRQYPGTDQFLPGSYEVTVIDNLAYRITYNRQDITDGGAVNDWTTCWPRHRLEGLDPRRINSWTFWSAPVGNGPYRHVRTVPQTMIEFEANPGYYRAAPKIGKVLLKVGGVAALPELLSGNIDAVSYSRSRDAAALSHDRRFRAWLQPSLTGEALWWNHRHFLFADASVRKALTHAINRRELSQAIDLPEHMPLLDFAVTERQLRRYDWQPTIPYDPEAAKQMLDRAGWRTGHGKMLRDRNGRPFRFKALVLTAYGENADAAVYVQDQLRRIGVEMEIITISDAPLVKSRIQSGEFEAAMMILGTGLLESFFRTATGYDNPAYFKLLEKAKQSFDPETKDRLYRELTSLFQEDVPATVLYPLISTTIASARVRGLEDSPCRGDLTQCMDELWLEEVV